MSTPIRVLILEDRPADAELMLHELRRAGFDPDWQRVETEREYLAHLDQTLDIILADYTVPQFDAPRALHLLKESGLDIPFIVVTGSIGEEAAVECMKEGAADYLLKDRLTRLGEGVRRALHEKKLRDEKRQAEEGRERLTAILEATTDFVGIADSQGRGIYLNSGGRKMLGIGVDEDVTNLSIAESHPEWARAIVLNQGTPTAIRDGVWSGETTFLTRDGREVPISQVILAHKAPDGSVEFLSTIARDITEQKRAEEQIQRQMQHLAALRTIDMAITASLDVRVTLNVVLDQVTSQLGVDAADILLLNPHTQMLEYAAGRGFHTNAIARSRLRLGEGHTGRAALERRIVSVPDLSISEPPFVRATLLAGEGFVSYYGAPLIAKGQVKGVLETFHRTPLDHGLDWLEFLDALAAQTAIAIDNAGLFDELQRSNTELAIAYDATLEGWAKALELRDYETAGHSQRVPEMTVRLARALGMSDVELVHVRRGALLHDIGKMAVPDGILLKPGPLTEEEWETMRRHPVYAYELLSSITFLRPVLDIPYCHHEKWDGTGYPRGLRGEQIPPAARIFAVVDVWDALRFARPYRPAWPEEKVRDHLREQAGAHFDPKIVEAFLSLELESLPVVSP